MEHRIFPVDAISRDLPSIDNEHVFIPHHFFYDPQDGNIIAKRKMKACDVILPSFPLGESQAW